MGIGQPWTTGLPGLLSAEGFLGDSITYGLGGLQTPRASSCPDARWDALGVLRDA